MAVTDKDDAFANLLALGSEQAKKVVEKASVPSSGTEEKKSSSISSKKSSRTKHASSATNKEQPVRFNIEDYLEKYDSKEVELVRLPTELHKKVRRLSNVSGIPITSIIGNIIGDFFLANEKAIEKYIKDNF